MIKYLNKLILCAAFMSTSALAEDCNSLSGSGDGVPADYYQLKCFADKAFQNHDFDEAANLYKKASLVKFFEAPNYMLRVHWAEASCLAGNKEQGKKLLESFILMARADLGEIKCVEEKEFELEYMTLACGGYGSGLVNEGRKEIFSLLEYLPKVSEKCSK